MLNLLQTRGPNCISLSTFCCSSWFGATVGRSGPSPWPLAPFPLASQNICSLSISWVGKLLREKAPAGIWIWYTPQHKGIESRGQGSTSAPSSSMARLPGSGDWVRFCRSAQLIRCFPEVHLASSQSGLSPSLPCSDSYRANRSGAKTSVLPGAEHAACKCISWWQKGKSLLFTCSNP